MTSAPIPETPPPPRWHDGWAGKKWSTWEGPFDETRLLRFYWAVHDKDRAMDALGCKRWRDARVHYALSLLKKHRLIRYIKPTGWVRV